MPLPKSRRASAPIRIEQTSLIKFCPRLRSLNKGMKRGNAVRFAHPPRYNVVMGLDNVLRIKETHCLVCTSRLVKNGHNNRLVIRDQGSGMLRFRIQRKCCPKCGEIFPELSQFAPRFANYHENYKKTA